MCIIKSPITTVPNKKNINIDDDDDLQSTPITTNSNSISSLYKQKEGKSPEPYKSKNILPINPRK